MRTPRLRPLAALLVLIACQSDSAQKTPPTGDAAAAAATSTAATSTAATSTAATMAAASTGDVMIPDPTMLADARAAANALGGDLMTMLTLELERGGPDAAIAICADSAQARTQAHQQIGIGVRRVGTRLRNARNAPDSLEQAILEAFQVSLLAGRLPADTTVLEALAGGGTRLRYLRPVRVQEGCLSCHGALAQIPASVRTVLRERYPDDRATGYAVGDLRGAVSVIVER